jgi:TPP-dependent pyruvate/acetoin dehydrogenase alpha subunit
MQGTRGVTVAYFGDGATNTGAFHESPNLAAVWNLPVLFICENNGYAFSTRQEDHQRIRNISDRAAAYGMPGQAGDGNDIESVRATVQPAVAKARAGAGATLFDFKTYRVYGQYDADDTLSYRSQEEIDRWKRRCPIERYSARLRARNELTDAAFAALSRDVESDLDRAEAIARASAPLAPSQAPPDTSMLIRKYDEFAFDSCRKPARDPCGIDGRRPARVRHRRRRGRARGAFGVTKGLLERFWVRSRPRRADLGNGHSRYFAPRGALPPRVLC